MLVTISQHSKTRHVIEEIVEKKVVFFLLSLVSCSLFFRNVQ